MPCGKHQPHGFLGDIHIGRFQPPLIQACLNGRLRADSISGTEIAVADFRQTRSFFELNHQQLGDLQPLYADHPAGAYLDFAVGGGWL